MSTLFAEIHRRLLPAYREARRCQYLSLIAAADSAGLIGALGSSIDVETFAQRTGVSLRRREELLLLLDCLRQVGVIEYERKIGIIRFRNDCSFAPPNWLLVSQAIGDDRATSLETGKDAVQAIDWLFHDDSPVLVPFDATNLIKWDTSFEQPFYSALRRVGGEMVALPGQVVADLGCGTGAGLQELLDLVTTSGQVIGVDVSHPFIAFSRKRFNDRHNVTMHCASIGGDLCFIDNESVDSVMLFGTLHFLGALQEAVLSNISRILCPNGKLFLGFTYVNSPISFETALMDFKFAQRSPKVLASSLVKLIELTRKNGLVACTSSSLLGSFYSGVFMKGP